MDNEIVIDKEKVKVLRRQIYMRESLNQKSPRPRKDSEMIDLILRKIKEEVDKCF